MTKDYRRPLHEDVLRRLREPRRFIQVVAGPRQVGKTTLVRQALESIEFPAHYASADDPEGRGSRWLASQWEVGRLRARDGGVQGGLLVIDEVQKAAGWPEAIKRLWDEDTASDLPLRVALLGSAPLLIRSGLAESLGGRFELIRLTHWSFEEMRDAFGWDIDGYVFFGGYPGAAPLVGDLDRWRSYIHDSLVETTLARDVLSMTRVDKPALLRQTFGLACDYSAQVLSYQKMLGQLQDAGNTTTLAHYLDLLSGAGLVTGIQKYSGSRVRQRAASPKLVALNTGLMTSRMGMSLEEARQTPEVWGRLVETVVGAHLVNSATEPGVEIFYWRHRSREVDYVLSRQRSVVSIEVTSGRRKDTFSGTDVFAAEFGPKRHLLVGGQGVPLAEFLASPSDRWLE